MASRNSVFRLVHEGEMLGQQIINTSYWRTIVGGATTILPADLAAFLDHLRLEWTAGWVPVLRPNYLYLRTTLTEITGWTTITPTPPPGRRTKKDTFGDMLENFQATGTAGGGAVGDNLPMTTCAVVHWKTALAGRQNRGRMKFGPFSELESTGDQMTTTLNSQLMTLGNTYRNDDFAGGDTFEMVVFSRKKLDAGPNTGPARNAGEKVLTHTIPLTWGVQRSRKYRT